MRYQTIIFDLDGTLLDTLVDLTNSVNHTLTHYQEPTRSIQEIQSFIGNGVRILLQRSFQKPLTEAFLEDALNVFRTHYSIHMNDHTRMYEGLEPVLCALKEHNKELAIVSNKLDQAVKELNQQYFSDYIPLAIGTPSNHKKPDPYSVLQVIQHYHSTPNKTIYVGDSEVDITTAHNAGIKCIGVSWGFRGHNFLKEHGADIIVDTPQELLEMLTMSD